MGSEWITRVAYLFFNQILTDLNAGKKIKKMKYFPKHGKFNAFSTVLGRLTSCAWKITLKKFDDPSEFMQSHDYNIKRHPPTEKLF